MIKKLTSIVIILLIFSSAGCRSKEGFKETVLAQLKFNRLATLRLLDEIEKTGKADQALAWRAGPGRAPLGWQIMHLASTEDRMAGKTLSTKPLVSDALAEEFKSGKPAGDHVPSLSEVRKYLEGTRLALEKSIEEFDISRLDEKPAPDARNNFRTIFQILMWHEGHHEGQAQATFNLFKAAHHIGESKPEM